MATGSTQPFRPSGTLTIGASTTSANGAMPDSGEAVLVFNAASGTAFIRFGTDLTVSAAKTDQPIPGGARMLVHAGELARTVAVVLASGTGSVFFSRGDGTVY